MEDQGSKEKSGLKKLFSKIMITTKKNNRQKEKQTSSNDTRFAPTMGYTMVSPVSPYPFAWQPTEIKELVLRKTGVSDGFKFLKTNRIFRQHTLYCGPFYKKNIRELVCSIDFGLIDDEMARFRRSNYKQDDDKPKYQFWDFTVSFKECEEICFKYKFPFWEIAESSDRGFEIDLLNSYTCDRQRTLFKLFSTIHSCKILRLRGWNNKRELYRPCMGETAYAAAKWKASDEEKEFFIQSFPLRLRIVDEFHPEIICHFAIPLLLESLSIFHPEVTGLIVIQMVDQRKVTGTEMRLIKAKIRPMLESCKKVRVRDPIEDVERLFDETKVERITFDKLRYSNPTEHLKELIFAGIPSQHECPMMKIRAHFKKTFHYKTSSDFQDALLKTISESDLTVRLSDTQNVLTQWSKKYKEVSPKTAVWEIPSNNHLLLLDPDSMLLFFAKNLFEKA